MILPSQSRRLSTKQRYVLVRGRKAAKVADRKVRRLCPDGSHECGAIIVMRHALAAA